MSDDDGAWRPHRGPQTRFLSLVTLEALFGGAAGGSKSASLVVDAIRYINQGYGPAYAALLMRRTHPELEKSILVETRKIYPGLGARWNDQKHLWTFPRGERVYLGHCQYEQDVHDYQGAEFQFIGVDELTTFLESQYLYLMSRLRSTRGIRVRMRAATNPGGEGHEWVFKRWGAWLDPDAKVKAAPGELLWFIANEDGTEDIVPKGTTRTRTAPDGRIVEVKATSRTFIPSLRKDNPSLDGTNYDSVLDQLDPVTRAQLRDGNWLVRPAAGLYFKRAWIRFLPTTPAFVRRVRYWDRAATEAKQGTDPDWTVGLRMMLTSGEGGLPRYVVDDVVRLRGTPKQVEATIRATAEMDGKATQVCLEQDPGQAGKFEVSYYVDRLRGFRVVAVPVMRDKITRAGPVSSQAEHGNVGIVAGDGARWAGALVQELEAFPDGAHDDQVDALSGAFAQLAQPPPSRGTITEWLGV